MKRLIRRTMIGATVTLCCGIAQAQTTVNGPYYAMPSWDQTMPGASRFVVLANFASSAVLDRETGLVWWRSPDLTQTALPIAQQQCLNSTVGGRRGWRLPSAEELVSLFDPTVTASPFLPLGHPFTGIDFNAQSLWTSTSGITTPYFTVRSQFVVGYSTNGYGDRVMGAYRINVDDRVGLMCVRGTS